MHAQIFHAGGEEQITQSVLLRARSVLFPTATTSIWTGAAGDSNYNNALNWTDGVPNGSYSSGPYTATIPGGTVTEPVMSASDTLTNLNIGTVSSTGSLTVGNGNNLYIDTGGTTGAISNNGTLSLASSGNTTQLALEGPGGTVTLSGTGTLSMSDNANNRIVANDTGMTLSNSSTIEGAGSFSNAGQNYTLTNSGTIAAVSASGTNSLVINPGAGVTNTGTLEAGLNSANTGTLVLQNDTFTNTNGIILANTGSVVQLLNSTISGGKLETSGRARFRRWAGMGQLSTGQ